MPPDIGMSYQDTTDSVTVEPLPIDPDDELVIRQFRGTSAKWDNGYAWDGHVAVTRPIVKAPRVAIVHEWLESYAGSERVLEQLLGTLLPGLGGVGLVAVLQEVVERVVDLVLLAAGALAAVGQGRVDGDAVQPGGDVGLPAEGVQLAHHLQQYVLRDVLHVHILGKHPPGEVVNPAGVLMENGFRREGRGVAQAQPMHVRSIAWVWALTKGHAGAVRSSSVSRRGRARRLVEGAGRRQFRIEKHRMLSKVEWLVLSQASAARDRPGGRWAGGKAAAGRRLASP